MPHDSFPALCTRRMKRVDDDACLDCFDRHPQLHHVYRLRMWCCEENLVRVQEPEARGVYVPGSE